jgi:alpha-galactosidase/6-phospho-beta-glucosidase family protein
MDSIKSFVNERRTGWQSTQIARIMLGGKYEYFPAINIMNNGCISNLNDDVVVEVPGVLGPDFVKGINMGPLPDQVLAFCQLHATQSNLIADAAALGDKEKALQALLIDPYISSVKKAEALLKDILDYNKQYDIRFK